MSVHWARHGPFDAEHGQEYVISTTHSVGHPVFYNKPLRITGTGKLNFVSAGQLRILRDYREGAPGRDGETRGQGKDGGLDDNGDQPSEVRAGGLTVEPGGVISSFWPVGGTTGALDLHVEGPVRIDGLIQSKLGMPGSPQLAGGRVFLCGEGVTIGSSGRVDADGNGPERAGGHVRIEAGNGTDLVSDGTITASSSGPNAVLAFSAGIIELRSSRGEIRLGGTVESDNRNCQRGGGGRITVLAAFSVRVTGVISSSAGSQEPFVPGTIEIDSFQAGVDVAQTARLASDALAGVGTSGGVIDLDAGGGALKLDGTITCDSFGAASPVAVPSGGSVLLQAYHNLALTGSVSAAGLTAGNAGQIQYFSLLGATTITGTTNPMPTLTDLEQPERAAFLHDVTVAGTRYVMQDDGQLLFFTPPGGGGEISFVVSGEGTALFRSIGSNVSFELEKFAFESNEVQVPGLGKIQVQLSESATAPSTGTVDMSTGALVWSHGIRLTSRKLDQVGVGPIEMTLPIAGKASTVWSQGFERMYFSLRAGGTVSIPATVPVFGGGSIRVVPRCLGCARQSAPAPGRPKPLVDQLHRLAGQGLGQVVILIEPPTESPSLTVTAGGGVYTGPGTLGGTQPGGTATTGSAPNQAPVHAWVGTSTMNVRGIVGDTATFTLWITGYPDGQDASNFDVVQMVTSTFSFLPLPGPSVERPLGQNGPGVDAVPGSGSPEYPQNPDGRGGATVFDRPSGGVPPPGRIPTPTTGGRGIIIQRCQFNTYLICSLTGKIYGGFSWGWRWEFPWPLDFGRTAENPLPPSGGSSTGGPTWHPWGSNPQAEKDFKDATKRDYWGWAKDVKF